MIEKKKTSIIPTQRRTRPILVSHFDETEPLFNYTEDVDSSAVSKEESRFSIIPMIVANRPSIIQTVTDSQVELRNPP